MFGGLFQADDGVLELLCDAESLAVLLLLSPADSSAHCLLSCANVQRYEHSMLSSGIGAGAVTTWCMLHGQSPAEAAVITVVSTITALVSVLHNLAGQPLQLDMLMSFAAVSACFAWFFHVAYIWPPCGCTYTTCSANVEISTGGRAAGRDTFWCCSVRSSYQSLQRSIC